MTWSGSRDPRHRGLARHEVCVQQSGSMQSTSPSVCKEYFNIIWNVHIALFINPTESNIQQQWKIHLSRSRIRLYCRNGIETVQRLGLRLQKSGHPRFLSAVFEAPDGLRSLSVWLPSYSQSVYFWWTLLSSQTLEVLWCQKERVK